MPPRRPRLSLQGRPCAELGSAPAPAPAPPEGPHWACPAQGPPPHGGWAALGPRPSTPGPAYPLALAGVLVGVVLQRQLAVSALDLLGGGIGLHLQDVVVLRLLHHGGCLWEDAPRYPRLTPPRSRAQRPAEAPRAALTAGRSGANGDGDTAATAAAAARSALRRPRLFRGLYTGPGRIFWNDAARDVTGLERSRTPARDVTGGARGGAELRGGPGLALRV